MAQFLIQEYNKEMTELVKEENLGFDCVEKALVEAYCRSSIADIVVLWRRNCMDSTRLIKIAKFY